MIKRCEGSLVHARQRRQNLRNVDVIFITEQLVT